MHGANRLGGNGVAESTVFGALAGRGRRRLGGRGATCRWRTRPSAEAERRALAPLARGAAGEDAFALRERLER